MGFEPTVRLPVHRISSAAHSTTLPPLREVRALRSLWEPAEASAPPSRALGACQDPFGSLPGRAWPHRLFRTCEGLYSRSDGPRAFLFRHRRAHDRGAAPRAFAFCDRRGRASPDVRFSRCGVRYRPGVRKQRRVVRVRSPKPFVRTRTSRSTICSPKTATARTSPTSASKTCSPMRRTGPSTTRKSPSCSMILPTVAIASAAPSLTSS